MKQTQDRQIVKDGMQAIVSGTDSSVDGERSTAEKDDPRVVQALREYVTALEAGQKPSRQEFLARYAEIAEALADGLAGLELVCEAAPQLQPASSSVADESAAFQALEPLGDYRIVRELGRGGMGIVYEALQRSLNRRVALKVLPFSAALNPKQLQRFKNEAQAAAQLHHTNIVPVFGVGCERGVHYYAMQFIDGQTLAAIIAELRQQAGREENHPSQRLSAVAQELLLDRLVPARPGTAQGPPTLPYQPQQLAAVPGGDMTPKAGLSTEHSIQSTAYCRAVTNLGMQAAEALEHAHQLGVVHRDIKPANLLVDVRGNPWITDFGLAHCLGQAGLTMSGDLVGTLRYMSPEQALAKRVLIDHRTDIYSLGATLYELLTLEPPFAGQDREELLRQIAFEEPRAPRRRNKSIPAELETIVLKAMEKNPAERYATARELADDLHRFLEDKPIRAKRPTLVQRAAKWGRRHRAAVVATAVVLALALVLLGGTGGWLIQRRLAAEAEARQALAEAQAWQKQARWPEARGAARRAEGLLTGAGDHTELRQRVRELLEDLQMVEELEKIRLDQSQPVHRLDGGTALNISGADAAYVQFFHEHGMNVEALGLEAGAWIHRRSIAEELAAALDNWAMARRQVKGKDDGSWKQLLDIARVADPDERRTQVRQALERDNRAALEELAHAAGADLSPTTLVLVSNALQRLGASAPAIALLREGQRRYPGDLWLNYNLADLLVEAEPPQPQEALRFVSVALALRPQNPAMYFELGLCLGEQGRKDEAVAAYRKAIELNPNYTEACINLGNILFQQDRLDEALAVCRKAVELAPLWGGSKAGLHRVLQKQDRLHELVSIYRNVLAQRPDSARAYYYFGQACMTQESLRAEAVAAFRKAIALKPDLELQANAYNCLGVNLDVWENGQRDEAVAAYRKAIELKPDFAPFYSNLGYALWRKSQRDEAVVAFRKAIELEPNSAGTYCCLGDALQHQGQFDQALPACRKAITLKPDSAEAHGSLAGVLEAQEQFEQALVHRRRAHELGSRDAEWAYPSDYWVWRCEGLLKLSRKLPALLRDEVQPTDATERFLLACACSTKQRYAAAARLSAEAFAVDPRLAEEPFPGAHYEAARAAVLAGCRQGKAAADLSDQECAQLRSQALSWLRADLAAWRNRLEKEPDKMRPIVVGRLQYQYWMWDSDFYALRRPDGLARLPEAERQRWQQFWADVQQLLDQAQAPPSTAPPQKPARSSEAQKKTSSAGR
jgi:serine/threonine protein kinase/Flp pilus assembly protein TadD